MKLRCTHEAEIRELLQRGHWPEASPATLRAHAQSCRKCGDLVLLTVSFRGARASASMQAQLPPPNVLWWRAQLLRRNAQIARINRPILGAHIFALAILFLIAGVVALSHLKQSADWLAVLLRTPAFHFDLQWNNAQLGYLVPGVVLIALLGGVAAYLASDKQ
jgi:hypothetical protein